MSSTETVKTRILCISDTHSGRQSHFFSEKGSFRRPFPKADILLHSGDLTQTGKIEEYRHALDLLKSFDAELKLVIAGNHDLSLDRSYYLATPEGPGGGHLFGFEFDETAPDVAEELWTGQAAKDAGVTYLTEGMHSFNLSNGAKFTVYASPYQPEFFNWAFNYRHDEDRFNEASESYQVDVKYGKKVVPAKDARPIPDGAVVDLCITHGPLFMHLDACVPSGIRAGCPHLLKAMSR